MDERYIIQSVKKSLQVLKCFGNWKSGYSLAELTKKCGMNKSNVLRILSTLESEQMLQYDKENAEYRLGSWFLSIASGFDWSDLKTRTQNYLQDAAQQSRLIVHFTVLAGDELIVLNRVYPPASTALALASQIGGSVPMHCTGAGKIIMAYAPDATQERLLSLCKFEKYTDKTITDKTRLMAEIQQVRKQGYALNNGEHEEYLHCLTRPVFYADGTLAAAVSLSGLREAFEGEKGKEIDNLSKKLASDISRSLGYDK